MLLQADLEMLGVDLAAVVRSAIEARFGEIERQLTIALARISELEVSVIVPGPQGERGIQGERGPPGEQGARGDPGVAGERGERGEPGSTGAKGERGDCGPPGERGERGDKGIDGAAGERGQPGEQGIPGRDGRDGQHGRDGATGADGKDGAPGLAGKDGIDGTNGRDGLGFDDLSVDFDGERVVKLKFARGEENKEFPLVLPTLIDRGVWREGGYRRGDAVTWDGSLWIAQIDTSAKPGLSPDWRLAVKRGRDGRAGKDGKDGPIGPKGERGEPGPRGYGG